MKIKRVNKRLSHCYFNVGWVIEMGTFKIGYVRKKWVGSPLANDLLRRLDNFDKLYGIK